MISLKDLAQDQTLPVVDVTMLTFDSREVKLGSVFFAIRGTSADGHKHLAEVVQKNPAAIVVEDRNAVPKTYKGAVVVVKNARTALGEWAARFFGNPGEKLFCVGVTGTNGKTTSVYILESIFNEAGRGTGVIGTIDHHFRDKIWETNLTTPDAVALQSRLKEFVDLGAKVAAFEFSSIAIDQDRATSVPFKAAIFTNFTRDHLDYHKTMENYFAAKARLFTEILAPDALAVLNADDEQVRKLKPNCKTISFGQKNGDERFTVGEQKLSGAKFRLRNVDYQIATPGLHNVYNAVGATLVALEAGVSSEIVGRALSKFKGAPGRLERVENSRGLHVFVDYAHTDDALRSVLGSLKNLMKESNSNGKLWVVFGCGGDRDKGKRPLMMKSAIEFADEVVLTTDNPRTEDPEDILQDSLAAGNDDVHVQVDRKTAIRFALQSAREDDVILVAGKGHENYQIIGTTKIPFSDVAVIRETFA
jgi:UDP-N-acetylmuramoyl-L-alanyl-D-glutamate--2,6-diaminopimelate ligase